MIDFADRFDDIIREAAVYNKTKFKTNNRNAAITVNTIFSLMSTFIMSEKIETWTPTIYPHIVKIENHYSASGVASGAPQALKPTPQPTCIPP